MVDQVSMLPIFGPGAKGGRDVLGDLVAGGIGVVSVRRLWSAALNVKKGDGGFCTGRAMSGEWRWLLCIVSRTLVDCR